MYRIAGFLRDLKYYLSTEKAIEFYAGFIGVLCSIFTVTFVLAHFALVASSNSKNYCDWKPERGISKVYYLAETPSRTFACWLWISPKNEEEKQFLVNKEGSIIEMTKEQMEFVHEIREEDRNECSDNRTKKKTK